MKYEAYYFDEHGKCSLILGIPDKEATTPYSERDGQWPEGYLLKIHPPGSNPQEYFRQTLEEAIIAGYRANRGGLLWQKILNIFVPGRTLAMRWIKKVRPQKTW